MKWHALTIAPGFPDAADRKHIDEYLRRMSAELAKRLVIHTTVVIPSKERPDYG